MTLGSQDEKTGLDFFFSFLSPKEDIKHEMWCDFGQFDVLLILLNSRSVVVGRNNGVYFITNNAFLMFPGSYD